VAAAGLVFRQPAPDHLDALALTFAVRFTNEHRPQLAQAPQMNPGDFNVHERSYQWGKQMQAAAAARQETYHPYADAYRQARPGGGYPKSGSWKGIGGRNRW
jgi:hypothetical protein